jgi:hypothetical protein
MTVFREEPEEKTAPHVEDNNQAYERVVNKDVRYLFVINMASLKAAA